MLVRNNKFLGGIIAVLFLFGVFSLIYLKFFNSNVLIIPGIISFILFGILVIIFAKKQETEKRCIERQQFASKYSFFALFSNMFIKNQNGIRFPKRFFTYFQNREIVASLHLGISSVKCSYQLDSSWSISISFSMMNLSTYELTCKKDNIKLFSATITQELRSKKMNASIPFNYAGVQYVLNVTGQGVSLIYGNQTAIVFRDSHAMVLKSQQILPELGMLMFATHTLFFEGSIFGSHMDNRNQL